MELEKDQISTSESKMIKILIEEYEENIDTESSREKKEEILDLFRNYSQLRSEEEFNEIKNRLYKACKKGDLDLIKIYISAMIEDESRNLIFKVNKTDKTASLFKINDTIEDIIIPRTVNYESTDYLITSISGTSSCIESISFVENSAVKTIHDYAFSGSKIGEIYFPESLEELKEEWCSETYELTRINVSPSNNKFIFKDDKYLLGKTDENKDEFDIFLFASRGSSEISIPSNIKVISSNAFQMCRNLRKIEIPTNSNLQTIGSNAFHFSEIEEIYFPESLKELKEDWSNVTSRLKIIKVSPSNSKFIFKDNKYLLGKTDQNKDEFDILLFARRDIKEISIPANIKIISSNAFCGCYNLKKIEIPTNSNLQTIESYAFYYSQIEEIYFPESLKELKNYWCSKTNELKKIKVSPSNSKFIFKDNKYLLGKTDENKDEFDTLLFARRDIKEISIPSNIKIISPSAFDECKKLSKVEIPTNSNLQTIESFLFSSTNIEEIFIPPNVSKICKYAFSCYNLKKVEIPTNSNLQTIESNAFSLSKIEEIYLSTSLRKFNEEWFNGTGKLKNIRISPLNNKFIFKDDKYLLGKTDESKDEFDNLLFVRRDIREISIPSNIKIISPFAFYYCFYINKIEIPTNSNLQIIGQNSFSSTNIETIFIPPKVSKICKNAFHLCSNLRKIEIPPNSNLQTIESDAFAYTNIEGIALPSEVSKIGRNAFSSKNLKIIEITDESKLRTFSLSAFSGSPELILMIPSTWNIR